LIIELWGTVFLTLAALFSMVFGFLLDFVSLLLVSDFDVCFRDDFLGA